MQTAWHAVEWCRPGWNGVCASEQPAPWSAAGRHSTPGLGLHGMQWSGGGQGGIGCAQVSSQLRGVTPSVGDHMAQEWQDKGSSGEQLLSWTGVFQHVQGWPDPCVGSPSHHIPC